MPAENIKCIVDLDETLKELQTAYLGLHFAFCIEQNVWKTVLKWKGLYNLWSVNSKASIFIKCYEFFNDLYPKSDPRIPNPWPYPTNKITSFFLLLLLLMFFLALWIIKWDRLWNIDAIIHIFSRHFPHPIFSLKNVFFLSFFSSKNLSFLAFPALMKESLLLCSCFKI